MAHLPGDIVYALTGRDAGKCFAVISAKDNYLYLCDGKNRKVDTPKKKNIKHVTPEVVNDEFIADKIKKGEMLTNKEIRASIRSFLMKETDSDY